MGLEDYEKHFEIVARSIDGKENLGLVFDLRDFEALLLGKGTGERKGNVKG